MKTTIIVRCQSSSSHPLPHNLHCRIPHILHFLTAFILVLGILSEIVSVNSVIVDDKISAVTGNPVEFQWCSETSKIKSESGINRGGRTTWNVPSTLTATRVSFTVTLTRQVVIKCRPGVPQVNFTLNFVKNPGSSGRQAAATGARSNLPEFLTNGYFHPNDIDYFHPKEFCISELTTVNVTVRVCSEPVCGQKSPCISKCCPLGQIFTTVRRFIGNTSSAGVSCSSLENLGRSAASKFHPILYNKAGGLMTGKIERDTAIHYLRKTKKSFNCSNNVPVLMSPFATKNTTIKELYGLNGLCFQIQEDGNLRYRNNEFEWAEIDRNDYCLDGFHYPELQKTFLGREEDYGVLICAMDPKKTTQNSHVLMYGSALIVSSIFLLLTFLVYLLLWGQQTICGWVTMSHAASMFFAYIFLGTAFLLLYTMGVLANQTVWCKILGILAHFFFISTFAWLSVISFDLFWTFRCFTPRSQRSKGFGRYLIYCFFGWGLPLIFVCTSVTVDWIYGSDPCSMVLIPSYGVQNCYVAKDALGRYIYYPIACLLAMNLILFAITTYKLHEYTKSTRMARENMQERQQLFKLFIKLYFIMGVTWIFEFLSWTSVGVDLTWYWAIFDFLNVLQAVAIFIIFVCKQDIVRSLIREYPCLAHVLNPIARCFTPVGRETENTTVTGVLTTPTLKLKLRDST